jgi:hypothetical protein
MSSAASSSAASSSAASSSAASSSAASSSAASSTGVPLIVATVAMIAMLYGEPASEVVDMLRNMLAIKYLNLFDETSDDEKFDDDFVLYMQLSDCIAPYRYGSKPDAIENVLVMYLDGKLTREMLVYNIMSSELKEMSRDFISQDRHMHYYMFGAEQAVCYDDGCLENYESCIELYHDMFKIYLEQALRHGVRVITESDMTETIRDYGYAYSELVPKTFQLTDECKPMAEKFQSYVILTNHEIQIHAAISACKACDIIAFVYAIDVYHLKKKQHEDA